MYEVEGMATSEVDVPNSDRIVPVTSRVNVVANGCLLATAAHHEYVVKIRT